MIVIRNALALERMRKAGALVYDTLMILKDAVKPGVTTLELDRLADKHIRKMGGVPSFLGYNGFPASLCTSVNEHVVHGIPNDKPLLEGDIVGLDLGAIIEGYHGDSALTVPVGKVSEEALRLIRETERCFFHGAAMAVEGNRLSDIGHAVETHAASCGYGVVRALCGHGIGQEMHEDPQVNNFGQPGRGLRLKAGMTIAIEPMINQGTWDVDVSSDGWVVRTKDRKLSSHYEHTVAIREHGPPELLTWPDAPKDLFEGVPV